MHVLYIPLYLAMFEIDSLHKKLPLSFWYVLIVYLLLLLIILLVCLQIINNILLICVQAKSAKAKKNSAKKKSQNHVGRGGWPGLEKKAPIIWPQLVAKYEFLESIQNERSKLYLMSFAKKDKETKMYDLPQKTIEDFKILVTIMFFK